MPIAIEKRTDHLHVYWSGEIVAQDLGQLFGELPAVAARCPFPPHILHTVDPQAELRLDSLEAFTYSKRRIATPIPTPVRAAFVAHSPAAVAIARNFENFNRNPHLTLKSFLTEADALAWILETPPPAPRGPERHGATESKEP